MLFGAAVTQQRQCCNTCAAQWRPRGGHARWILDHWPGVNRLRTPDAPGDLAARAPSCVVLTLGPGPGPHPEGPF
eukprot:10062046-Alexandrium_andersonii.AAC.1